VDKCCARIHAIGSVDELNSHLGVLLADTLPDDVRELLLHVQHDLFDLGGALAYPVAPFSEDKLLHLDVAISRYNDTLPALREFILPGGTPVAAQCHVARTVTRRAERDFVTLTQLESVPPHGLPYLNRLSDLLFVLSRVLNRAMGQEEIFWKKPA
jgi:cob(I)alamin adenosyltransferase